VCILLSCCPVASFAPVSYGVCMGTKLLTSSSQMAALRLKGRQPPSGVAAVSACAVLAAVASSIPLFPVLPSSGCWKPIPAGLRCRRSDLLLVDLLVSSPGAASLHLLPIGHCAAPDGGPTRNELFRIFAACMLTLLTVPASGFSSLAASFLGGARGRTDRQQWSIFSLVILHCH
jgi:hypothetical protein